MDEPITIKKKKKLTIKAKAPKPAAAAPTPATDDATPQAAANEDNVPINIFDKTPAVGAASDPSYVVVGILAMLATLMFIGLVLMQWTEFSFLQSAFPRPIQTGF